MSREIKFRLYSKFAKKYIDYITIGFSKTGELRSYSTENGVGPVLDNMYIVEQYTGLKDKNGKEIYEGDIIQEEIDYGDKNIDGVYRYAVYWNDDFLSWSLEGLSPDTFHTELYETNMSREIIVNVHEHPELVKGGEL